MQEIPQVADGKRDGCPNLWAGDRDIGSPGRVGNGLYSDWCKSALELKHGSSRFHLSLKITSVISIIISLRFGLDYISTAFTLVSMQLTVRNSFQELTLELY
jgi:hypothetical protein